MSTHEGILFFDGKAVCVKLDIMASAPISQALKGLEELSEIRLTMVPHGEISCAGFARIEDRRFFLMYFPPRRRQILWRNKDTKEQKQYIVSWPHCYIGVFFRGGAIENGYAMVSRKKLASPKDRLSRLPLPNTSKKHGHICEGAKGMWEITRQPEETAVLYAEYFMKSEYISDINDHWPWVPKELWAPNWDYKLQISQSHYESLNQQTLSIWETLSEKDPKAVENISWGEHFSIQDLLEFEWNQKTGIDGNPIQPPQLANVIYQHDPLPVGAVGQVFFDPPEQ